ncbi:MAG: hypothetical protein K0R57_6002 [Paenibacillaceae bacterium]|jgi:hypothetical protein|nr:hypothetical protein [Paenibacillaceae bacterium]
MKSMVLIVKKATALRMDAGRAVCTFGRVDLLPVSLGDAVEFPLQPLGQIA